MADFRGTYQRLATGLDGTADDLAAPGGPEQANEAPQASPRDDSQLITSESRAARDLRTRRARLWREIETTYNFWTTLEPLDEGSLARLEELVSRHRWEILFLTERPATAGESVQRQTQRWLADHGFHWPSVFVNNHGARGRIVQALAVDVLIDDDLANCLDVLSESSATPILVRREPDGVVRARTQQFGIGLVATITEALDLFEATESGTANRPWLVESLRHCLGLKSRVGVGVR